MENSKKMWLVEGPSNQQGFEERMRNWGLKAKFLTKEPIVMALRGENESWPQSLERLYSSEREKLETAIKEKGANGAWIIHMTRSGHDYTVALLPFRCERIEEG